MRLIIVDDHEIVRDGLRLMLDGLDDIDVVGEAAEGRGLLDLLDETPADVVLLDLHMEGIDGLDTLSLLSEQHPAVRVVVLTMSGDSFPLRRAIELGARGYVLKSSGRETLVEAIRTVHGGGAFADPQLARQLLSTVSDPEPMLLSDEDVAIVRLLAAGAPNRDIAEATGMTQGRLRRRLEEMYAALGAGNRAEAVAIALRRRLID
jgi:DNA-binding NarL/FixJ family response regulator